MITVPKQHPDSSKEKGTVPPSLSAPDSSSSAAQRKLSVELPTPRLIYTTGSTVTGIIRLGTKDFVSIERVQVSLVCTVRSIFYEYPAEDDACRSETTKLIHQDQTLWDRALGSGDANLPPADLPFSIVIPQVGNDTRRKDPNAALPPSFEGGRRAESTHRPIGYVEYHIKASVKRKGFFKSKERAYQPFIFLPPSPPPPLLPSLPESISYESLDTLRNIWKVDTSTSEVSCFFTSLPPAHAITTLWLPDVPSLPRLTKIPFFLCLAIQSHPENRASMTNSSPPKTIPEPKLDKASLHLRRDVRVCASHGAQHRKRKFDKVPTDNFLHGLTLEESDWSLKNSSGGDEAFWEKWYMWRGLWTFKKVPDFKNRQLTVEYTLVAEIPIKGIGNDAKLVSRGLNINSGVTCGDDAGTLPLYETMDEDFPPDYFDDMGGDRDEDYGENDHKEKM